MTYKCFLDKYKDEIFCLDVYDKEGREISEDKDIPQDAQIIKLFRQSGSFEVVLDIKLY